MIVGRLNMKPGTADRCLSRQSMQNWLHFMDLDSLSAQIQEYNFRSGGIATQTASNAQSVNAATFSSHRCSTEGFFPAPSFVMAAISKMSTDTFICSLNMLHPDLCSSLTKLLLFSLKVFKLNQMNGISLTRRVGFFSLSKL